MNWKTGLFRLWIVGSVVWVVFTGTLLFDDLFSTESMAYCNRLPSNTSPFAGPDNSRELCVAGIKANTQKAAVLVFSVPLFALIAGFAGIWITRGFRSSSKS